LNKIHRDNVVALRIVVDNCMGKLNLEAFPSIKIKEISSKVFQIAKEGKVLSSLHTLFDLFSETHRSYLRKRIELTQLYLKQLKMIAEELNSNGIEYYVFKTIKPFPYDMTDIDLLFTDKVSMLKASTIIIGKLGYKAVSKGTYSLTLRRTINGYDIDVDLQPGIYVGTLGYIKVIKLKEVISELGYFKENIHILRPELELAVIAGHSTFKDFSISLANVMHADYILGTIDEEALLSILRYNIHLVKPVIIVYSIVNALKNVIELSSGKKTIKPGNHIESLIINQLMKGRGNLVIPLNASVETYLDTFQAFLKYHEYGSLLEMIKLPSSRGIGILFRRVKLLPYDSDPINV